LKLFQQRISSRAAVAGGRTYTIAPECGASNRALGPNLKKLFAVGDFLEGFASVSRTAR
jgi:hypothetical protein